MCQNYGHHDSTLDLIIKRTAPLTARLPVRCREEKRLTQKDRTLMSSLASHRICCKMCVWKWKHTRVCLDGVDDCAWCGGISAPALPSVPCTPCDRCASWHTTSVAPKLWWTHLTLLSSGRKRQRLWVSRAFNLTDAKKKKKKQAYSMTHCKICSFAFLVRIRWEGRCHLDICMVSM